MLATLAPFSAACESSGASDSEVLINIADDIAVPAYQAVAQDMAQLNQTVEALCKLPNGATLDAARQSWRDARASWMASEALWFGPVIDRRSQSLLDWSPADVDGVEQLLARSTPLTVEEVSQSLASNQRGFGAIEYGLFHGDVLAARAGSPSEVLVPNCAYVCCAGRGSRHSCGMGGGRRQKRALSKLFHQPLEPRPARKRRGGRHGAHAGIPYPGHR